MSTGFTLGISVTSRVTLGLFGHGHGLGLRHAVGRENGRYECDQDHERQDALNFFLHSESPKAAAAVTMIKVTLTANPASAIDSWPVMARINVEAAADEAAAKVHII